MPLINNKFELDYIPARVCDGKELTIKYYYWDMNEQRRKRKVMRFNSLLSKFPKREVLKLMHQACAEINIKLQAGKNPSVESEMPKAYKRLSEAMEIFSRVKNNEMRSDSIRSYKSYLKRLTTYMEKQRLDKCYVINFTRDHAVELMTELELDKAISNRTWNNYMVFYRSLWNWLIEKNYCRVNVFGGYKKKREAEKMRTVIDRETHDKIVQYCRKNMPNFEIIIDLVRASFIRPAEICRIQIENIDLKNGVINIPGGKSKTKNFRYAYLPDWLVEKISSRINLKKYPGTYYFITRTLLPGTKKADTRELDKHWAKMRDALHIGMEKQLYSYRDTGITSLENMGVQRRVIIQLTDHKTEKMAGRYIGAPNNELINNVVNRIT